MKKIRQRSAFLSFYGVAIVSLAFTSSHLSAAVAPAKLEPILEWTKLEFDLGGGSRGEEPPNSKAVAYDYAKNALGTVRVHKDRLYLSVPRWKDGVPATLNVVDFAKSGLSPKLRPFPSLGLNVVGDCAALQSVTALEVSPDGLLWVADSGTAQIFSDPIRKCPAKLIVYDLNLLNDDDDGDAQASGAELMRHAFPENVVSTAKNGVLMHMVVDLSHGSTDRAFVYLSDINSGSLVVYDRETDSSWKRRTAHMRPKYTQIDVVGSDTTTTMRFGVTGLALQAERNTPEAVQEEKGQEEGHESQASEPRLFFSTLGSTLYSLPTWTLRNASFTGLSKYVEKAALDRGGGGDDVSSDALASDDLGRVYYGVLQTGSIGRWNASAGGSGSAGGAEVLVDRDDRLQWINAMFVRNGHLWIASNRFHLFSYSDMTFTGDANFRIFRLPLRPDVQNYQQVYVTAGAGKMQSTNAAISLVLLALLNVITKLICLNK